jgi:SAM-dependent methyltransferase
VKRYDQAYFDRWYRDPASRVKSAADLRRKAALAVAVTEYYIGRPLAHVVDVGCGEGSWRAPLVALRPRLRWLGIDDSEYAVGRYGRTRGIIRGRFADLPALADRLPDGVAAADLLVCADVLHYVSDAEIESGLPALSRLGSGIAWIEVFCRGDEFIGDRDGFITRPAAWYRRRLLDAGWLPLGGPAWLHASLRDRASRMELGKV